MCEALLQIITIQVHLLIPANNSKLTLCSLWQTKCDDHRILHLDQAPQIVHKSVPPSEKWHPE